MELNDAQRALVEEHLWLVRCIAHSVMRRVPPSVEMDDLVQAGHLGLVQAAQKYDEDGQSASFATFARFRVNGAIGDYLRSLDSVSRQTRHKITAGEADDFTEVDLGALPKELEARGESPEQASMAIQFTEQLRSLVEGLSGRERTIIQQYYFHERTMLDIGRDLGCRESRVSQMHKNIIEKLRNDVTFVSRAGAFRFALDSGIMRRLGLTAIALLVALAPGLRAQPVTSLRSTGCRSTSAVQIVATVPVSVSATNVPVPICLDLGPGLKLNLDATPPRIELDTAALPSPPAQTVVVPRMVMKRVVLSAVVPDLPGITQVSVPLDFTPAPNTLIVAVLRSSRLGGDVVEIATPGAAQPKQVQVTLPVYRPFTTDDVLTFLYWTSEAP